MGTKLLGFSIGRGSGALKSRTNLKIFFAEKVLPKSIAEDVILLEVNVKCYFVVKRVDG